MNTTRSKIPRLLPAAAVVLAVLGIAWAATPPPYLNYQGVLRDSAGHPLDGARDMVFRFFTPADEEILVDRHTAAQGGAVTVSGGMFDVWLGAGATSDGSGPGTYGTLIEVFRDYGEVYLEVQIGADGAPETEVLSPRTRVISSAYALNASNLAGQPITSLLRSNETDAYTFGTLTFSPGTALDVDGTLAMDGAVTKATTDVVANFNADLLDGNEASAFAAAAHGHTGGEITGPVAEASQADNADTLDGFDSSYFLNTSTAMQTKSGPLIVDSGGMVGSTALDAVGQSIGGHFSTATGTGWANVAMESYGIRGFGTDAGGYFEDPDSTGIAWVGSGNTGIWAEGSVVGGYFGETDHESSAYVANEGYGIRTEGNVSGGLFQDSDGTGWAYVGHGTHGIDAYGTDAGGYFKESDGVSEIYLGYTDSFGDDYAAWGRGGVRGAYFEAASSSGHGWIGWQDYGMRAQGDWAGGYFLEGDSSAQAWLAEAGYGIDGYGPSAGGYFRTQSGSGYARVGYQDEGISAHGTVQGGFFADDDSTGQAHVAYGDYGIEASGTAAGGYFHDSDGSGEARVGSGEMGIEGRGSWAGGYFHDSLGSGYVYAGINDDGMQAGGNNVGAFLFDRDSTGGSWVGYGDWGIYSYGNDVGGYFQDLDNSGYAYAGFGDYGIAAYGNGTGGYFEDTDASAHAYVAVQNIGIDARGNQGGGYFADKDSAAWSYVGYDTYKVYGVGTVAFVQNHPYESDKIIAYNSPEGDEVATYTRGTARLVDGEARVALGETFAWVTNPDIGLTVYLTPLEEWCDLFVAEKSTTEIVVRARDGSPDVAFDYLVYGLRIGFEEKAVIRPKEQESFIPSMAEDRSLYDKTPELRSYSAFERFKGMHEAVAIDGAAPLDLSASQALRAAIHEYDPGTDPPLGDLFGHSLGRRADRAALPPAVRPEAAPEPEAILGEEAPATVGVAPLGTLREGQSEPVEPAALYPSFPVSGAVEVGDLVALDPESPGSLRRASTALDPGVIGIVAGEVVTSGGVATAPVALSDLAVVKADAGYGEIRPGDLLTSSYTPGHAMRAAEVVPGTVIGKALEPLESGTGSIRVLVMPR